MGKKLLQIALEADKAAGVISEEEIEKLSDGWKDTLIALVERGPLFDGDVPSKSSRDSLMEHDFATRVVASNGESYWSNAATEKGVALYKQVVLGKGVEGTLEEAVEKRKSWDKEEDPGDHEFRGDYTSESAKVNVATEGLIDRLTVKAKDFFKGKWKTQGDTGWVSNAQSIKKTKDSLAKVSRIRSSDVPDVKLSVTIARSFWEGNDRPVPTNFKALDAQLKHVSTLMRMIRDNYWSSVQRTAAEIDRTLQTDDPAEALPKFRQIINTWFPTPIMRLLRPLTTDEQKRLSRTIKVSDYLAAFQFQLFEAWQREDKDSPVYQKNLFLGVGYPPLKDMKLPETFETLTAEEAQELLKLVTELHKTAESFTLRSNISPVLQQLSGIYHRFLNRLDLDKINASLELRKAANEILTSLDNFAINARDVMDTTGWSANMYIHSVLSVINLSISRMK